MNTPSSPEVEVLPRPDVCFKPLLPPLNLTRWQRFCAFMKTPESGFLPLGIMVAGAHIFAIHYLVFSKDFVEDFEDDEEAHVVVKKMLEVNKSLRSKFDRIRASFSGFKE